MKLTYIENIRLPTEKAHGFQIMKTSEALVRAGLEVELFVADRKNPISDDAFAYYQMTPSFPIRKLPVIDLMPIVGPLMRFAYAFERWTFLRAVKRLLEKSSVADAAYTRDPVIADAIRTASPKTPLFVELHDDRSSWPWQELSRSVTGWIVISQALKRVLVERRIASDRILVEPDAYDASAFADLPSRADARSALGIPDDMFLLVYTGKLFRWKGVDTIAPAFDSLPPNCQVAVIGGHPDDVARVKALAGPSVAVRFVGELLRNEAYRWLAAADAAILPTSSKFDIGMLYTSPLKLFEYAASRRPIWPA